MTSSATEPQLSAYDIDTLQRKVRKYESQPNDIGELRKALVAAKSLILEQEAVLARVTTAATVTAVVLRVWTNPITPQTFKRGMVVRLIGEALTMEAGELGIVERELDIDGTIEIDFDLIGLATLRIAPGRRVKTTVRQLEFVQSDLDPNDISNYVRGRKVRVISGPATGITGTLVLDGTDGDGEARVELDRRTDVRPYFYVGFPQLLEPVVWSYGRALIVVDGKTLEVDLPKDIAVNPGDLAKLNSQTMQILGIVQNAGAGPVVNVLSVIDEIFVEVTTQSETRLVFNTRTDVGTLEEGDRVVLDSSGQIVMRNLGKPNIGFKASEDIHVEWSDIAGLEEPKELLHDAIILPHTNPALYAFYKKRPMAGVLIYGPPGNGKTLLGKAAVTAIRKLYGGAQASDALIYVKAPEILNMMVGESERMVRDLFARAKRHKKLHGYPAVIFIDEAEAILARRGSGISSDVNNTIVPAFLVEMDGMEDSSAIVMLATNRPDILDPAVVRDGRVDHKVYVGRPTKEIAPTYFQIYLRNIPLCNGYTRDDLATLATEELYSSERVLYGIQLGDGSKHMFTLSHLASGAMIANVINIAVEIAMRRDKKSGTMEGVRREDIIHAIDKLMEENRALDHSDAIREFLSGHQHPIADLQPHHFVQASAA